MKHKKIDGMLVATFLTTIFYSATYPFIHKEIMSVASENLIAINQIINCISIVMFGWIWNKTPRLFDYYHILCIVETLLGICSSLIATLTGNIIAYYIIDTLIFSIVTRNIVCGGNKLRAMRYSSEADREHFDNNNLSANATATIIGSVVAMALKLDFIKMLWIATVGNAVDNIFYIAIYKAEIKKQEDK
jgi:uncharacterized membrane protein YdjX (TVP38/TMEM64 family)